MSCKDCDCEEEMSTEDIVESNNIVLNALIDALIEKKIISEEDLRKRISEMESVLEDDSVSDEVAELAEKIDKEEE